MLIKPLGDTAFSVEFDENLQVRDLHCAIRGEGEIRGLVAFVPAMKALLIRFDPALVTRAEMETRIRRLAEDPKASEAVEGRLWQIAVRYDGPDLEQVAQDCGLGVADIIALHGSVQYEVRMLGFMPGFAYMGALPEALRLPRRAEPRLKVPAGSVAIADDMTAIYPWESPGGWHLLGHSSITLFDQSRDPPALLAPGDRVEFVAL